MSCCYCEDPIIYATDLGDVCADCDEVIDYGEDKIK